MNSKTLLFALVVFGLILKFYLAHFTSLVFFNIGLLYDLLWLIGISGCILFIKNKHLKRVLVILVFGFFTIITIVNHMYYEFFKTFVTRNNIQGFLFVSASTISDEYAISIPIEAYLLIILLIGLFVMLYRTRDYFIFNRMPLIVCLIALSITFIPTIRMKLIDFSPTHNYFSSDAYLYHAFEDFPQISTRFGYFVYHTIDLLGLSSSVYIHDLDDLSQQFFETHIVQEPNPYSNFFKDANLIILTVESFDSRFIDPVLTPNLNRLKNEGYQFPNFYVPTYFQGATCNTEFMMLNSLYAINSNPNINNVCTSYSDASYPYALPNQLKNIGYQTYYFHSGYAQFYNRNQLMPNLGFDNVIFNDTNLELALNPRFDTDLAALIDKNMNYESPFYMQILTYAMHGAYNQDDYDVYQGLLSSVYPNLEKHSEVAVYYKKLIDFDVFLGMLLNQLKLNNVYDDTLIIIHSDHYPYMMHDKTFKTHLNIADEISIYQQTLIMYHSKIEPKIFTEVFSTIDLAPTFLNLLYQDAHFDYFLGTDVFTPSFKSVLFHNHMLTDGTTTLKRTMQSSNIDFSDAQLKQFIAYELTKAWLKTGYYWELLDSS